MSTFTGTKGECFLIIATVLYFTTIFLSLFSNENLIYICFIFILVEFFIIKQKIIFVKESLSRTDILLVPIQVIFVAASFSIYHVFMPIGVYIVFVLLVSLFSIGVFVSKVKLLQNEFPEYNSYHIAKKIIAHILIFVNAIPVLYSFQMSLNGLYIKIDFLIYGLILLVYPYAQMLIMQHMHKSKINNSTK